MTDAADKPASHARALLLPAALGLGAGAALIAATGLSPLASSDRPALALIALCISLPLGAALRGLAPFSPRETGAADQTAPAKKVPDPFHAAIAALLAGLLLSMLATAPDPDLFARTASWCAGAALLGQALGSITGGAPVTLLWLALCAGPFAAGFMGSWQNAAELYAMQGCPWLGFSQDALGGDPLRKPVLYLGQWSTLSDQPALGLLTAAELWAMAALALAASMLRPRR